MRQRMRLAGTLVHEPDVLILDEPLNGADPRQRVHFKRLLQQLAAEGRTIVLSSHILEEVEELAETVLLIVNGKLAASGGFRAIRAALNQRPYHVRVICDAPRALAAAVVALAVGGRRARRSRRRRRRAQPQRARPAGRAAAPGAGGRRSACAASSRSTTRSRACSATSWRADAWAPSTDSRSASSPAAGASRS